MVLVIVENASHSICFIFFFKQKAAYEKRISDWSSDVCSSDLGRGQRQIAEDVFSLGNPHVDGRQVPPAHPGHDLLARVRNRRHRRYGGSACPDVELGDRRQVIGEGRPQDERGRHGCIIPVDRKSTRLNSSYYCAARIPSSASQKKLHAYTAS